MISIYPITGPPSQSQTQRFFFSAKEIVNEKGRWVKVDSQGGHDEGFEWYEERSCEGW
jgi:hypothetical protein